MSRRVLQVGFFVLLLLSSTFLTPALSAQRPASGSLSGAPAGQPAPTFMPMVDLDVYVKGTNGSAVEAAAVVTLTKLNGQVFVQGTTKGGYVRFNQLPATEFMLQVVAPAYETVAKRIDTESRDALLKVTIELRPVSDAEESASEVAMATLPPKVRKEMGKALEALRANKPGDARGHIETAYRLAPANPEVSYAFGFYFSQLKDTNQAKNYWTKTLELYPKHLSALLSLSDALLQEKKPGEALPYLNRAMEVEPSFWRVHALLAEALLLQGSRDEAIQHAERALELGHARAATLEPLLAHALAGRGDKERAIGILQNYLKEHPTDAEVKKQLERLQNPPAADDASDAEKALNEIAAMTSAATALPVPSNWLPPDVDEQVPPVEPGAACDIEDVLAKAENRIQEFVKNVDRFTATESVKHETINKWGFAESPQTRKFEYVVSIGEVRGFLNVEEYRSSRNSQADFPDGVATNGLPALVLIFHPLNAKSFEMNCEGLGRWNGALAWQVHFRQRGDKPNTIRAYRLGADGPSYHVGLKGRAWIAADSYQILRLETDLIAPMPQIRLAADRTIVEYGPVHFKQGKVDMWLPQSAEVFYDWRGKRSRRRHSFSNYLLFGVDEKQRISAPKVAEESPSNPAQK